MVIDCHYHLEERVFTVDRLIREMQKSGIDKVALMGSMIEPFAEPPRFLIHILQLLLENSIARGLGKVFVSNFTVQGDIKIMGKSYPIEKDPDNEKVFDTVKKYPDKFVGWIFVNPRGTKTLLKNWRNIKTPKGLLGSKLTRFGIVFRRLNWCRLPKGWSESASLF